jgi:hypothetical protein
MRVVSMADLFNTGFVEVVETEIGGFVAELKEAVESSTGSTRGGGTSGPFREGQGVRK